MSEDKGSIPELPGVALQAAPSSTAAIGSLDAEPVSYRLEASGDNLDDLVVAGRGIEDLRLERLGPATCWGCLYLRDGRRIVLTWIARADGQLTTKVSVEPR